MGRTLWCLILVLAAVTLPCQAQQSLSPQALAWIKEHPRVYYTVNNVWPQESVKDGKHIGLSREVLDEVTRRTGITFIYVSGAQAQLHPPMMISAITGSLLTPEQRQRWLFTFPWINTMPIIVSTKDQVQLRTLNQMQGKRIAVGEDSEFTPWIRRNYPAIQLVVKPDVRGALQSVEQGESVAAIASGMVVLPILQRHFSIQLGIVAQIPEMVSGINMGVDPAYPELRDILNSVMANISARDAERLFAHWVSVVDIGTPTLLFVIWQYRYPLIVIGLLLLMLLIAMRYAWVSRQRAIRSEQHKSQFLAVMSHEIRTPMNAIIAALELQQKPSTPAKQQEYQALALSASQDMLELLNNVLDHSKLTQKQMPLHTAPCDLSSLLMAVCDSQRPSAERKGLKLLFDLEPALQGKWFEADAHRLRQIVNNLLSNAVKFTDLGDITLHSRWQDEKVILAVRDTGIGIASSDQQRLFQAWQQADNSGAQLRGGSGLGLYLSRQLTRQMGGELTLHSEPGVGSTFCCELPLSPCEPGGVASSSPALAAVAADISVLVVEDHPANQQVLAAQLLQLGCHYEMAESAEQAMCLLEEENYYDLMLLDCNLPGKDGYWLAAQIRQFERAQQRELTPLIAISAVSSVEHRQRCLESGMDDVLVKPIRLSDLASKLGLFYPGNPPAPAVNTEMQAWLKQDLDHFAHACDEQNQQNMIYFIHRVRGVALMYQLDALANISDEIEIHLRQQRAIDIDLMAHWQQQLQQHSPLSEPD